MNDKHVCNRCNRMFAFSQGKPQDLTQVEQLLCARENLPFSRMSKISCPYCGQQVLALEPSGASPRRTYLRKGIAWFLIIFAVFFLMGFIGASIEDRDRFANTKLWEHLTALFITVVFPGAIGVWLLMKPRQRSAPERVVPPSLRNVSRKRKNVASSIPDDLLPKCGGCGSGRSEQLVIVRDKNMNRGVLCLSCKREYANLLKPDSVRRFWLCKGCNFRILAGTKIDAEVDPHNQCPKCGEDVNLSLVNLNNDHPVESGILGQPVE